MSMLDCNDAMEWRHWRWPLAALVVISLHVSIAAFAMLKWPVEMVDDEPSGVVSLELAPLTATASAPVAELALRSDASDAVRASRVAPPPAEVKESHAMDIPVTESSPVPDAAVSLPPPEQAKIDEKPDDKPLKPDKKPAELRDIQPQAVAQPSPPPVQASDAATPVRADTISDSAARRAARQGRSNKPSEAQIVWQKALLLQLDRNKRYPAAARQKHLEGTATVQFSIDRAGKVILSRLAKSSGVKSLDDEAINVLDRASPLPAPPPGIGDSTIEIVLPIQFRFKN
jgi:protein TonB